MARAQMAPLRRPGRPEARESDRGGGNLLIFVLSAFVVLAAAKGINHLTGLPFLFAALAAAMLCATKMYFLRYQPPQEVAMNGAWDRSVAYVVTAFFSVALAAFGLYGLTVLVSANAPARTPVKNQLLAETQSHAQDRSLERDAIERKRPIEDDLGQGVPDLNDPIPRISERSDEQPDYETLPIRPLDTPVPIAPGAEFEEASSPPERFISPLSEARDDSSGIGASKRNLPPDGLQNFVRETFEQNTYALGCWLAPAIFEALILILVLYNRPRVYYYY